jgi:hypothetical protein
LLGAGWCDVWFASWVRKIVSGLNVVGVKHQVWDSLNIAAVTGWCDVWFASWVRKIVSGLNVVGVKHQVWDSLNIAAVTTGIPTPAAV